MIVLGITDSITSGATIVSDGKVLAAVSEERLSRQKMDMGFPNRSITEVLKITGIDVKDIDCVSVATNNLFWRPETLENRDCFRESKGRDREILLGLGSTFAGITGGNKTCRQLYYKLKSILNKSRRKIIPQVLEERWGYRGPVSFVDHHLAHCASAYFTSGMDKALVVSLDGAGDFCSNHVYVVEDGNFVKLNELDSYDSIGNYYAYITHICGFQGHKHEGKITGLAAYGEPNYLDLFNRIIKYEEGTIKNISGCFDRSAIELIEKGIGPNFSKKDLSASIQYVLEDIVTEYIEYWIKKCSCGNLALAGGVFANVKLNQRVYEMDSVNKIFIHPGMGDEGLATGAALYKCFELCQQNEQQFDKRTISDVFWGSEYTESEIEKAIRAADLPFKRHEEIESRVAQLLAQGKVVARFSGKMEYGPRALGNRSVLYQTTDSTVNDWLNKKLKRTEFMPFAPVTLKEYTDQCYKGANGAEVPAEFMTITFDCTEWMKENCPAVVHVDDTARPQIIDSEINNNYYKIIDEYRKITGIPSVINTSFNMHEEPIVCTPGDAIRAFKDGHLDYLAIENYLVVNERQLNC